MPFTIEFSNADDKKVLGGVSYITLGECRVAYHSMSHDRRQPVRYYASLLNEKDALIEVKPVDEYDVRIMLGVDEL